MVNIFVIAWNFLNAIDVNVNSVKSEGVWVVDLEIKWWGSMLFISKRWRFSFFVVHGVEKKWTCCFIINDKSFKVYRRRLGETQKGSSIFEPNSHWLKIHRCKQHWSFLPTLMQLMVCIRIWEVTLVAVKLSGLAWYTVNHPNSISTPKAPQHLNLSVF